MNLKEKQKVESRQKILNAASQLFRKKGFHATGVDELMEKAGLTAGAFYAHFKSKSDLLKESLMDCLTRNRSLLFEGTEGLEGKSFVEAILRRYVSEVHRDHPELGCPLAAVGAELHRHPKETNQTVATYLESFIESMLPHLKGSADQKREKAIQIICQAVGAILLSRLTTSSSLSGEIIQSAQKVNL